MNGEPNEAEQTPQQSDAKQPQKGRRAWCAGMVARITAVRDSACVWGSRVLSGARTKRTVSGVLIGLVVIAGIALVISRFSHQDVVEPLVSYDEPYRLVPETVSQSAYIPLKIPDGVATGTAPSVRFTPELAGEVVATADTRYILYKPQSKPVLESYYNVSLALGSTTLSADFKVVEDPRITTILPATTTEAHEDSKISVLFNRPMVPLTTLGALAKESIPVTLEPEAAGTWKWKSTRLLQFIPDTRLARATTYTVKVREGFHSRDGVSVPATSHTFTTRSVRLVSASEQVSFNEPWRAVFNQPVDLERTKGEITLTRGSDTVAFIASYGEKPVERARIFGLALFGASHEEDRSVLLLRPAKDTLGREGNWDFATQYAIHIAKVYPEEGDVALTTSIDRTVVLPPVRLGVTAESNRSSFASPALFDPEGTLVAQFAEPVSIRDTSVALHGLRDVRYGETCKLDSDGNEVRDHTTGTCVKVEDHTRLRITVDPGSWERGAEHDLVFDKVVNEDGLTLNDGPLASRVQAMPQLSITRTVPDSGASDASLTDLTVCSNVPLMRPTDEGGVRAAVGADGYIVFPNEAWMNSYLVEDMAGSASLCARGEFQTIIRYGLHPDTPYTLSLALQDEFGVKTQRSLSFTTGPAPVAYTRFFNLQKYYNVTSPGKTTLTFAVENLPSIYVSMCKVSGETMLKTLETDLLKNALPSTALCNEIRSDVIDVPDTYWVNKYFQLDPAKYFKDVRGHYILTFYHPSYRADKTEGGKPLYEHVLVSVSNLAVGEKRVTWWSEGELEKGPRAPAMTPHNLYWVIRGDTLAPVADALVDAYESVDVHSNTRHLAISGEGTTGADGVVRIPARKSAAGAVVTSGGETAIVSANADTISYGWGRGPESRTYIYTDRPIYRPGDTVHIKAIDRVGYDNVWKLADGAVTKVTVRNSRNDIVSEQTVSMSAFGTLGADITLPADAPLGGYSVEVYDGMGWFDVEEYEGAAFKVNVTPKIEEYVAGDTASYHIDARYYFDIPVAGAKLEYTVVAQDYHFDKYVDEYFNFGAGWYDCPWCGYGDEYVTRGSATLDDNGAADISIPLDWKAYFDNPDSVGSKLFTVIARVQDSSGRQVSQERAVIVHRGEFYLGVRTDAYAAARNEPVHVAVKSVDTNGAPMSLSRIKETVNKITWESYKRREVDGGYYWHSEEKRTQVSEQTLSTDNNGNASAEHAFADSGEYEVRVSRTDDRGNTVLGVTRVYVYGGEASVRPTNNETLAVSVDKPSYEPGDTAHVLVESPFKKARALVTVERGDVYEYWTREVTDALNVFDIPIRASYGPNMFVSALLVGEGPEVKYGSVQVESNTDAYALSIDVASDKTAYLPGEEVVLSVVTKNALGTPVPADVSIAVVDMSVLALKGNPKKNPLIFYYDALPLAVATAHSAKNLLIERDIPTGTKGGGGGDARDLASRKRGTFKDTAYWEASVMTDEHGQATVRFRLPDNLTTWQVESLGVTKSTLVGVTYDELTTKKPLMAVPLKPRFIIPGDTLMLGMQIMNNTDRTQSVRAGITSSTLSMHDTEERTVRVGAGEQAIVWFSADAPRTMQTGLHTFTMSAIGDGVRDEVEQVIPILHDVMFEVTATAALSTAPSIVEYVVVPDTVVPGEGELTVRARPTIVASLLDAVRTMADYPYGCSEQIASKLASLATVRRIEKLFGAEYATSTARIVFGDESYSVDEAVQLGLRDLLGRQSYEGGFSFYQGTEPSVYLTVEVMAALSALRRSGYSVPDDSLSRAANYAQQELASKPQYANDVDLTARAAYAFASSYVPAAARQAIAAAVGAIAHDPGALERMGSGALALFAASTQSREYAGAGDIFFAALENRLAIDARGAYVRALPGQSDTWFESTEKNTALFIRAVAERGGNHPSLDLALRTLLSSRDTEGGWGSTNATFSVLDAALHLAEVREEQHAAYALALSIDGAEVSHKTFDEHTLLESLVETVPIDSLVRNMPHAVRLAKTGGAGSVYYDMVLRYAFPPESAPPRDEGITVERTLTRFGEDTPISRAAVGDTVTGRLEITVPERYRAVSIESYIPAGFEIVNYKLATENARGLTEDTVPEGSEYGDVADAPRYDPADEPVALRPFPVSYEEAHDDRVFAFADVVEPGTYVFEYTLRARIPGTFKHMPATVSEMYTPEVFGRTAGGTFTITERL